MGKLMNHLQKQLKEPEHKKDAEECIEIYNWIKSTDKDGCVWSSRWSPLVDPSFEGWNIKRYKLNVTGKALLKGIRK
tara:strand:+ start:438 stop:668 length:231 start_codon:yes stop_codon:yes gene_type:complete